MGRRIVLAMCCILTVASSALAQSVGSVTGRVTSSDGGRPVAGVAVVLVGTTRAAITDNEGRFNLGGLAAGVRRLEARRIGFVSATQSVTVAAAQAVTANFSLPTSLIEL